MAGIRWIAGGGGEKGVGKGGAGGEGVKTGFGNWNLKNGKS